MTQKVSWAGSIWNTEERERTPWRRREWFSRKKKGLKKWEEIRREGPVSGLLLSWVLRNNIGNCFFQKYKITVVLIDIPISLFPWTGFPIPKLDMLSQLEGGEEQWVPDPQDLEERDILRVTYTGKIPEWTCSHGLHPCWNVIIICPSSPSSASESHRVERFRGLFLQKARQCSRMV